MFEEPYEPYSGSWVSVEIRFMTSIETVCFTNLFYNGFSINGKYCNILVYQAFETSY